jgi:hypothetical protein
MMRIEMGLNVRCRSRFGAAAVIVVAAGSGALGMSVEVVN